MPRNAFPMILLLFLCGCTEESTLLPVVLTPVIVDNGNVRMIDNPLRCSFDIENTGDQAVQIKEIGSSCGCTIARPDNKTIPAHKKVTIPVTVNIYGQTDDFSHQLQVFFEGYDETLSVEIKGHVVNDLRYSPSVVRLAVDPSTGTAKGNFEVFTDKYPDIQFDDKVLPDRVTLREVSRSDISGEMVLRLSIEVIVTEISKQSSFPILLQPTDLRIAPLEIPIQCLPSE